LNADLEVEGSEDEQVPGMSVFDKRNGAVHHF
jgi:hypothetical protein